MTMTLADGLQIIGLFGAAIGLFLNWRQLKANYRLLETNNRQKAAEFIIDLNNSIFSNAEINNIYYEIEYDEFQYTEKFHKSKKEIPLDNLLDHFESIAKLYLLSNFTLEDLEYLAYNYLVVYQNESIQKYLSFLDKWYENRGMKVKPYSDFRKVGKILEKKFFDEKLLSEKSKELQTKKVKKLEIAQNSVNEVENIQRLKSKDNLKN